MLLLNYWTKIWTKITQAKKSRARWTEKRQQNKGIANADKQNWSGQFFCPDNFFVLTIFLFGQKGIYHQVEFC